MRHSTDQTTNALNEFDVFLIHNSEDKPVVEALAEALVDVAGLRPFLDKWHLIPGEPWQEALEQALDASRTCAVFLGPSGIGPWANEELRSVLDQRVREKDFRVIPVLLPGADPSKAADMPRFLKRLTWVDFSMGLDNTYGVHRLVAGIRGLPPGRISAAVTEKRAFAPKIVHALPPAPTFVGRRRELNALRRFWFTGKERILSLVALGGAGKTAIVAEFLSQLLGSASRGESARTGSTSSLPDGLFVWSFYADQDMDAFLRSACEYFGGEALKTPQGMGALYILNDLLADGGHHLIVLDGLERVQRPSTDKDMVLGQLDDPLLRQFLSRLALGLGHTKCMLTSRFPITDLRPWRGKGYAALDVEKMAHADARNLLHHHRLQGSGAAIKDLIERYGAHALTLDLLGSLLQSFFDGDITKLPQLLPLEQMNRCSQAQRLLRVFQFYEKYLPPDELSLLCTLCVFRIAVDFGILSRTAMVVPGRMTRAHFGSIPHHTKASLRACLDQLIQRHLVLREGEENYTVHPAVRDHFAQLLGRDSELHRYVATSLVRRPGTGLPRNKHVLDTLEEAIYHLVEAGDINQARSLYRDDMGGYPHLLWTLGDYSRVLRILRTLGEHRDEDAMIACQRAIGTAGQALAAAGDFELARVNALLLQGRLRTARRIRRNAVARFLAGQKADLLRCHWPDLPFPVSQCLLYAGRVAEAKRAALADFRSAGEMWDWRTRVKIVLARVYCMEGNLSTANRALRVASEWAIRSGAQEDICSLYIARLQLAVLEGRFTSGARAAGESSHIAERCGFGLHFIDLSCEKANLLLNWGAAQARAGMNTAARNSYSLAQRAAMHALNGMDENGDPPDKPDLPLRQDDDESTLVMMGARHPECAFAWGELKALGLLRRALEAQSNTRGANEIQEVEAHLSVRLKHVLVDSLAKEGSRGDDSGVWKITFKMPTFPADIDGPGAG